MKVRHDFETKVKEQPRYNTQLTQLQIQRLNNKEPKKCQKIFCALGLLEGFNINSCLIFDICCEDLIYISSYICRI